ncbi:MAG: hypothetical protein ABSH36_05650 [Solirubrobacteraceae bacterium]
MSVDPVRLVLGGVPKFEAEEMRRLRTLSRKGSEHELGELLLALAQRWAVSFEDMVIATERSAQEVTQIIEIFCRHDEICRANAVTDRLRRHALSFT